MKKITISLFIMLLNLSCSLIESDIVFFKINTIIGDVKITSTNGSRKAAAGEILKLDDAIVTGEASFADILYGNNGFLRIYDNSNVKISSLLSNISDDTLLNLKKGRIFSVVDKLKKGSNYRIKTATTVVAVRGTSYRIEASEKNTTLEVVTGKVAVKPVVEGKAAEEAETVVNEKQVLELDNETAKEISEQKSEIPVLNMEPEVENDIRADLQDIEIEKIPVLKSGVKKEFRQNVMKSKRAKKRRKNWWKRTKIRKQKMRKLRVKRRKLLRKRRMEFKKLHETGQLNDKKLKRINRKLDRIEKRKQLIKERGKRRKERIKGKRKRLKKRRENIRKKRLERRKRRMSRVKRKERAGEDREESDE